MKTRRGVVCPKQSEWVCNKQDGQLQTNWCQRDAKQ